jgi:hypothetical protein
LYFLPWVPIFFSVKVFEGVWGLAALRQVLTYFQKVSPKFSLPFPKVSPNKTRAPRPFYQPPTATAEWAIAAHRAGEAS